MCYRPIVYDFPFVSKKDSIIYQISGSTNNMLEPKHKTIKFNTR